MPKLLLMKMPPGSLRPENAERAHTLFGASEIADADYAVALYPEGELVVKDRFADLEIETVAPPASAARPTVSDLDQLELLGVPFDRVEAITMDGAHWLEVFHGLEEVNSSAGPVLRFRVAQAPGGKRAKPEMGVGQGDIVTVPKWFVRGVIRKNDATLSTIGGALDAEDPVVERLAAQLCEDVNPGERWDDLVREGNPCIDSIRRRAQAYVNLVRAGESR